MAAKPSEQPPAAHHHHHHLDVAGGQAKRVAAAGHSSLALPGVDQPVLGSTSAAAVTGASLVSAAGPVQMISSGAHSYSYAPTAMRDRDGTYKMWFGGLDPSGRGDAIFYCTSKSPNSGWSKPKVVMKSTPGQFDALDVCDPSVIRDDHGKYYMYYGGAAADNVGVSSRGKAWTRVGLATSSDGVNWTPVKDAGGNNLPIVSPANPAANSYGAGQPSVTYSSGHFTLTYTDTTVNGPHLYMIRSADPTFRQGVEAYDPGRGGWVSSSEPNQRPPLLPGADTDVATSGPQWVTATRNLDGGLTLQSFSQKGAMQLKNAAIPGIAVTNDVAFIRTDSGALAIRDGNKFDVLGTVRDPSKAATDGPNSWSLRNFTLQL